MKCSKEKRKKVLKNSCAKIYANEYASDLRGYEHYFPCRPELFSGPIFHYCLSSFHNCEDRFHIPFFIRSSPMVTLVGFKTHLALHRCKHQPGKEILRILTISSLTCLFSLLLYERDGE